MHYWRSLFLITLIFSLALNFAPSAHAASYSDELVAAATLKNLSSTTQWLRLLHYEKGLFGGYKSQDASPLFFLASHGKSDPQAELEATIREFFSTQPLTGDEQHPQCRFPARYMWLKSQLSFDSSKLPEQSCKRFAVFKAGTRAKSISVVFSSYYLNNPSSAFGHSFIRLNKSDHSLPGKRHELLDYGISYAAVMNGENPAIYAFKGMFGLYPGTFTSVPYYYKVREYNDYETRDLWEYDLNMTPAQVEMLVAHIWELGPTYFNYWYLTQNCSYQVLTTLEAANPELTLTQRQNKIVIPVDTIKVLVSEPGLVSSVHYRPSVRALFERRLQTLPPSLLPELKKLTDSNDPLLLTPSLTPENKVALLDAAADYIDSRHSRELANQDSPPARWKQGFLLARSQIPIPSQEIDMSVSERDMPHLSHGSRRADFDAGYSQQLGSFQRLAYRFSLHDLLDPRVGYPEQAQIEMFGVRFRHNAANNSFWIDDLMIFNVTSLSPLKAFDSHLSWRISMGGRTFYDQTCDFCGGPNIEGGAGYTVKPFGGLPLTAYLMGEGEFAASPGFKGSHFRPGAGPAIGMRYHLSDSLISMLHGSYRYQAFVENADTYEADFNIRWGFHPHFAVNLRAAAYPNSQEGSLGLLFYH